VSESDNASVVRRYADEVWSKGNVDLVDELFSSDFVRHGPEIEGGQIEGREGFKQLVSMYRTAFPDLAVPIGELFEEGDRIAARWIVTGTNTGPILGQDATGKRLNIAGLWYLHLRSGQISEEWVVYDTLALLQQMGLPMPLAA
jgi:steroid delta-isomerase-like uncharacterized protein